MFAVTDGSVNGVSSDPFFAVEIAPGKKAMKEISFWDDSLAANGITRYTDIGLAFRVYDIEDYMADDVANTSLHLYPYGEDRAERFVREPQPTDIVLADTPDVTVVVIGTAEDEIWGQSVLLYIENRTDTMMMISVDEVSVNGFMVDPFFATDIGPDCCGFTQINWDNDTLAENGIEKLEEIEMELRAYDSMDWNAPDYFLDTVTFQP